MSDKIEAHYENGELKLKLPKIVDEKVTKHKKIEIIYAQFLPPAKYKRQGAFS